mgnify:CR=1 FL=1
MRASKVNKAGKAPIVVLISLGDERVVFSTGKLVALESWNKDKQCVRGVNSEAVALNEFIKNMRVRIYEEEIKPVLFEVFRDTKANADALVEEYLRDYAEMTDNGKLPKRIKELEKKIDFALQKKAKLLEFNVAGKISYISTGGGALLEAIEGKVLPGVAAIKG